MGPKPCSSYIEASIPIDPTSPKQGPHLPKPAAPQTCSRYSGKEVAYILEGEVPSAESFRKQARNTGGFLNITIV